MDHRQVLPESALWQYLPNPYQHTTGPACPSNTSSMSLVIGFIYICYMPSNFLISSKYFCPNGLNAIPFRFRYPIVMTSSDFSLTAR